MKQSRILVAAAASVALVAAIAIERHGAATQTDRAISGELVRCQASNRSLTLRTEQGEGNFVVADAAGIHEGTKTVALADVCAAIGHRIKIWYRESGSTRTVHDIRISLSGRVAGG